MNSKLEKNDLIKSLEDYKVYATKILTRAREISELMGQPIPKYTHNFWYEPTREKLFFNHCYETPNLESEGIPIQYFNMEDNDIVEDVMKKREAFIRSFETKGFVYDIQELDSFFIEFQNEKNYKENEKQLTIKVKTITINPKNENGFRNNKVEFTYELRYFFTDSTPYNILINQMFEDYLNKHKPYLLRYLIDLSSLY